MRFALVVAVAFTGCARFYTDQTDTTTVAPDGTETRTIKTKAAGTTFAAGKQALAGWKATQTDKTQGASVNGLGQESDASNLTKALGEGVAAALIKAAQP